MQKNSKRVLQDRWFSTAGWFSPENPIFGSLLVVSHSRFVSHKMWSPIAGLKNVYTCNTCARFTPRCKTRAGVTRVHLLHLYTYLRHACPPPPVCPSALSPAAESSPHSISVQKLVLTLSSLHPQQVVNCRHNSRLVVDEDDLRK